MILEFQSFTTSNPLTILEFNIWLAAGWNNINFLTIGNIQPGEKVYNLAIQTKIESMEAEDNTFCRGILYYCFNLLLAKEINKISSVRCQIPGKKKITSLNWKKPHYASSDAHVMHKRETQNRKYQILHITQMNTDRKTQSSWAKLTMAL